MAKVILMMQYDIDENKRDEYFKAVDALKDHFAANQFIEYSLCEQKGKRNSFVEMFTAPSEEAYKNFEESEDETAESLAEKILPFIVGKARYIRYIQVR